MSVLVVDDSAVTRMIVSKLAESIGEKCIEAESGVAALDYLSAVVELPKVIVLDIYMPGIDGYETASKISSMLGKNRIPIIFLTSDNNSDVLFNCLTVGDDYISKPVVGETFLPRLKVNLRRSEFYSKINEQNIQLKQHQRVIENEHRIVETIFTDQFQHHLLEAPNLLYYISSKSVFNGDVLLTAAGPTGNLYIALGDVTGHGLPAAVGAMPVYPMFRTMARKGLGVGTIAAEMNSTLLNLLPDNMMLAITLLELNSAADTVTVWSGGMPAMIVDDGLGNIKQLISPQHCPLAMLSPDEFMQDVRVYSVSRGDRIFMFTDGLEESRNEEQAMFSEERLHAVFDGSEKNVYVKILDELAGFIKGHEQDDDISLLQLTCTPDVDYQAARRVESYEYKNLIPWSTTIHLSLDQIKQSDSIPQIIRLMNNAMGIDVHQDYISTILSEGYNNAVDHGLLKLDSSIKQTEEGFLDYYQQRKERLILLESGWVEISITFKPSAIITECGTITITISDSGDGFDQSEVQGDDDASFGRGEHILRSLCDSVEYANGGSSISMVYSIKPR